MNYSEYQPTQFDHHIRIEGRENWILAPVSQTRDSGILARANFQAVLEDLGGESETLEVHRFGHWGPGWYEIIIVSPERAKEVEEWEAALENYPVADEDLMSRMEWEEACETWEHMGLRDRIDECKRARVSILAARHDYIPEGIELERLVEL